MNTLANYKNFQSLVKYCQKTLGRPSVKPSQYNYVSMHVLNICVRVCGLFVKQNYKSVSLLFNLDN